MPSLSRRVLALAVPAFAALLAQPLMLLADTVIVGNLGTTALAGLGLGSGLLLTMTGLAIFLAYGSTAVVSRRVGAGDQAGALGLGVQSLWLALVLAAVVGTLAWLGAGVLVAALGGTGQVHAQAVEYLRWSLPGLPGMLVLLAATGTFRGMSDARTPLVLLVAASALNVVLNVALVVGLQRGIGGAGLGTALAETAMGVASAWLIGSKAHRDGAPLRPLPRAMLATLSVGAPLIVRTVGLRCALLLTTYVAASNGATALAAHHVAMNLWSLLANALDAIAIAGQTIIGTALGARDAEGTREATGRMTRWSVWFGVALALALFAIHWPLAGWLSPDDEVAAALRGVLLVVAAAMPLAAYVFLLDGVLIGAGDGRYLAAASALTVVIYAPIALATLLLPEGQTGLWALWVSFSVGFMGARAITLGLRARTDRWIVLGEAL